MILNIFIGMVVMLLTAVFSLVPVVALPDGFASVMTTAVQTWNAFIVTFPYAGVAWSIFLIFILPFEIGMLLLKFFLGSRTPTSR